MKVLWLTSEYHPRVGGIERYVQATTARLSGSFEVSLVTGHGQHLGPMDRARHAGALNLSCCSTELELAETRASLREIVRRVKPDLVHFASAGVACFAPDLVGDAALYCTVHGKDLTRPWQKLPGRPVEEAILDGLARCRGIIAVSEYTASHVRRRLPDAQVRVILHGIDLDRFPAPTALASDRAVPRILTVARLIERKGHALLLRALERVTVPFHWDIVGAGPLEPALMEEVARSSIRGRVTFHGRVDDAALSELFRRSQLFALLPVEIADHDGLDCEGFGLVYLEAAAHGKPSVATSSGGPAEAVLDGVTGLLANPTDVRELAAALEHLASSPERCAEMGLAARAHVAARFSLDRSVLELRGVYESGG